MAYGAPLSFFLGDDDAGEPNAGPSSVRRLDEWVPQMIMITNADLEVAASSMPQRIRGRHRSHVLCHDVVRK